MNYFDRFFKEKNLDPALYEVQTAEGTTNFIPSRAVIAKIKQTKGDEAKAIENILRRIDFMDGDIHHFLGHLAQAIAVDYQWITND